MGMIVEDMDDHEGYAARPLSDGSLTSTWIRDTAAFDTNVAACTVAERLTAWADHILQLTTIAERQRHLDAAGRHEPERGSSL